MRRTLTGLVRLVHPFPSILDGLVALAIALVAGAGPWVAVALGVAMTVLQFGIGATNDLVDADRDALDRPSKPIPAGAIGRDRALVVALIALAGGLALSAAFGPAVLLVALVGTGVGLGYDVALKGTAWAWVAYAVGIPLLPVYAWVGATGSLPVAFLLLMPAAAVEGAALALANPLTDLQTDRRSGVATPAVRLGARVAWRLTAALQLAAVGIAVGSLVLLGAWPGDPSAPAGRLLGVGLTFAGAGLIGIGVWLSYPKASRRPPRRQLAWEIQAVGAGTLAVGWILAIVVPAMG
jgi:4-hydroxybenzoate polyprenyltransferase